MSSTASSRIPWGGTRAGFDAKTEFNRRDFGLTWNVALDGGGVLVGEKVTIELEVEAVKKAEPTELVNRRGAAGRVAIDARPASGDVLAVLAATLLHQLLLQRLPAGDVVRLLGRRLLTDLLLGLLLPLSVIDHSSSCDGPVPTVSPVTGPFVALGARESRGSSRNVVDPT